MKDNELISAIREVKGNKRTMATPSRGSKTASTMLILGLLATATIAAAGGYQIFTAISNFNVLEAVDVFRAEDGQMNSGNWTKLTPSQIGGSLELPIVDIKAGESHAEYLLLNNTANAGVLGVAIDIQNSPATLTHELLCDSGSGMKWVQDNQTFYIKLPSQTNYKIGLNTTASGDVAEGAVQVNNVFLRNNALSDGDYTNTC